MICENTTENDIPERESKMSELKLLQAYHNFNHGHPGF